MSTTVSTPRKIAAPVSANATLAKGRHTPVDATGSALTMTLPTDAAAGVEVSVEKTDASANAVTVTGTMRGVASQLITLTTQHEARTFLSEGAGSWRPVSDHRTASALSATFAPAGNGRAGNRMVALGDSQTIGGETATQFNESFSHLAAIYSGGALQRVKNAGVGGNTAAQMLARFDTDVTPYAPTVVTILTGANDGNQSVTLAAFATTIKAIVAKVFAIGAVPVLMTTPPNNYASGTSQETLMRSYNAWIQRYASAKNLLCLDVFALVSNPAQQFKYQAIYDNGDGIHPNTSGHRVIGQALWNLLQPRIAAVSPLLTQYSGDPLNIVAGGLFLTDSNADGLADSWNSAGTPSAGTYARSIVTDANVVGGKMQRLTVTGATGGNTVEQYIQISGGKFAVGDRIRCSGILTSTGGTRAQVFLNFNGGNFITWYIDGPVTRGAFCIEAAVPAGATVLQPQLTASGGTGSVDFGQVTLYNLTTMGVATL